MGELKKRFGNLLCVKSLVTLIVITVFAVLALRGQISSDIVMTVVTSVISFYFGTQHQQNTQEMYKKDDEGNHRDS